MGFISNQMQNATNIKIQEMVNEHARQGKMAEMLMKHGGTYSEEELVGLSKETGIPVGILSKIASGAQVQSNEIPQQNPEGNLPVQQNIAPKRMYRFSSEDERVLKKTQSESDIAYNKDVKVSKNITMPQYKAQYDALGEMQKDVDKSKFESDKKLKLYERQIEGTNPTPTEMANINHLKHQNAYLDAMSYYYLYLRDQMSHLTESNKADAENLKRFNAFVDANEPKIKQKFKNGTYKNVMYDPSSQEFKDVVKSFQDNGIDLAVISHEGLIGTISGGNYTGIKGTNFLGDKVSIMAIPPKTSGSPDFVASYLERTRGVDDSGAQRPDVSKPVYASPRQPATEPVQKQQAGTVKWKPLINPKTGKQRTRGGRSVYIDGQGNEKVI